MNSKAQVIAIAEHFGWHGIREHTFEPHHLIGMLGPLRAFMPVPDYLNDLNAMHEAEKGLDEGKRGLYCWLLNEITSDLPIDSEVLDRLCKTGAYLAWIENCAEGSFEFIHATAAQRAEAFLRTVGKWEESA